MKIPESFWNFNVGHLGIISSVVVGGAIAWANVRSDALTLRRDHDALAIKVDQMDQRGTQASQRGIYVESEHSKANELRLVELERQWREAGPKLERIDVNVMWLMHSQVDPKK